MFIKKTPWKKLFWNAGFIKKKKSKFKKPKKFVTKTLIKRDGNILK